MVREEVPGEIKVSLVRSGSRVEKPIAVHDLELIRMLSYVIYSQCFQYIREMQRKGSRDSHMDGVDASEGQSKEQTKEWLKV